MKIQMQGNKIGVEALFKQKKKTAGGIIIPEADNTSNGKVLFIGPDYIGKLKVGDTVFFGDQRQQVRVAAHDLIVMEADNIFGVMEEEDGEQAK